MSLFALLRVLEVKINGADPLDNKILGRYIRIRFHQIVAFEAWQRRFSIEMLFKSAVQKTLHELKLAAFYEMPYVNVKETDRIFSRLKWAKSINMNML